MKVSYNKLFAKLKENEIRQTDFFNSIKIGGTTIKKLRENDSITTNTICRICDYFHCMPDEIMEWISDEEYEKANVEKLAIEAQIAELQAKLKQM